MRRSWILPLILCGCPKPPVEQPVDARPLPEAKAALEMLEEASAARKSMRAEGRLTYFGDQGRVRLNVVQVVERPARFRFETLTPFGQPIDVMTSDGDRLWLLSKQKLHEGPATPENISRLLPLPLRAEEVVSIMLGGAPVTSRFSPKSLRWADDPQDFWVLSLENESGERGELLIDPKEKRVVKATLGNNPEAPRMKLAFDDFEPLSSGGSFPRAIHLELPGQKLDINIKLKEVEVNVELAPTLFVIEPPPGVVPEPMPSPPVVLPSP